MFSKYINYNSKRKPMLFAQIAVAFVMFIFVVDKGYIYNLINNLHKLNFVNLDVLLPDIMSFSKVAMIDHLLFVGLGYALLGIFTIAMFIISLIVLVLKLTKVCITIFKRTFKVEKFVKVPENNIYLLTEKFIC